MTGSDEVMERLLATKKRGSGLASGVPPREEVSFASIQKERSTEPL